jgi:hypothetical protein
MEETTANLVGPAPIHLVLTPSQREALQAILNLQRNPKAFSPWYADATITFDHYPFNFAPITPGTDLALGHPYALGFGVEFTSLPTGKPVYAVSAANFSGQTGNVVSLNDIPNSAPRTTYSTFAQSDGSIVATFSAPVNWVTIDVWPYNTATGYTGGLNIPYVQALDANMTVIATTSIATPAPNTWQTLPPITRQQADISVVVFTLFGSELEPVGAVFDNLHFKRPTP